MVHPGCDRNTPKTVVPQRKSSNFGNTRRANNTNIRRDISRLMRDGVIETVQVSQESRDRPVTVVTVSFNTIELTALLLWSLHQVLDSDVVVARGDVLRCALAVAARSEAAIVGERQWDRWREMHRFELYSLLIDPAQIWRPGAPTFSDDGDPSFEILQASQQAGQVAEDFPFAASGYLIHRGRASLAGVAASGDRSHPLYEWALEHHEPHFGGIPHAREKHEMLLTRFRNEVGDLNAASLITSCRRRPS